ncbi:MAG TPA: sugar ABC transporter ATP-binding protein [Pirellulales bacterium]|jgi:rhamnose transport system ATP-binding protein|nr:sugar ABC transporter ATP-binding protein [Pirellulales bacterium]
MDVVLRATGIAKSFGGVRALKGVSFELFAGEMHGLIGENGAGKSTLIKIITGAVAPDAGELEVSGRLVAANDPLISRRLGIAAIYQQPALFPDLSVAENIAIGLEPGRKPPGKRGTVPFFSRPSGDGARFKKGDSPRRFGGAWRWINWGRRRRRAAELLERIGARIRPDADVRTLSMPEQQLVEIARALGADARILVMDEPTASLSEREVEHLVGVIRQLRSQGVGIIYVTHRLEELAQIADRVTALRDGALVGTRAMKDVSRGELIQMMVGRELSAVFPKIEVTQGEVLFEARGVNCRESGVRDVSVQVRAGEILGLAGLVGAGRTELARVLFGITPADRGQILLGGRPVRISSPAQAVELGIAYLPEDRRRHGVILEMPVAANATLAILRRISTLGWLDSSRERSVAETFVSRLGIKTASIEAPVENLSGGNQQKVALARWLATKPKVLIVDEPTQGIDVGSKAEIHRLLCELAQQGLAIVMISSEMPEILGMSDRIAVMHAGTIVATLDRAEATQEKLLAQALGHTEGVSAA